MCAIGAMYGSEDSYIEAQCSQKVDCHHVDSFMDDCNAGAKLCHHPKVDRNSLSGKVNITLPGFSTTAGFTEVMTISVAYSKRKKSA